MDTISFADGSLWKSDILDKVLEKSLANIDRESLLRYSNNAITESLFEEIRRVFEISTQKNILLTNSLTEWLYLLVKYIKKVGWTILVQSPTYFWLLRQLKELNVPYEIWDNIDQLDSLTKTHKNSYIYLISNFNSNNWISLDASQKNEIRGIVNKSWSKIIEDNPYDLLHFGEAPDTICDWVSAEQWFYTSSFSKIISPALRLWFISHGKSYEKMLKSHKITTSLSTSSLSQQIAALSLKQDYLNDLREHNYRLYQSTTNLLTHKWLEYSNVSWGIFSFITLPDWISLEKLHDHCKKRWLIIEQNKYSYIDNKNRPYVRINFVKNSEKISAQWINILKETIDDLSMT